MNHFERLVKEYDVTLVANYPKEYDFSKFHQMGINCVKAPIERQISILKDFKALFALRRIFKNGKFASVHSVTPKAGLLTAVASWMAGIKIRIHIFTGQVWATRKGVMRAILKMMDKVIATLDNHILVDGEGQRQFLIREGVVKETESSVLANGSICGVKLEKFNISAEVRKREREQLGLKKADVVYIFLGRLNHEKVSVNCSRLSIGWLPSARMRNWYSMVEMKRGMIRRQMAMLILSVIKISSTRGLPKRPLMHFKQVMFLYFRHGVKVLALV